MHLFKKFLGSLMALVLCFAAYVGVVAAKDAFAAPPTEETT